MSDLRPSRCENRLLFYRDAVAASCGQHMVGLWGRCSEGTQS